LTLLNRSATTPRDVIARYNAIIGQERN
jgi:hypothetical protein